MPGWHLVPVPAPAAAAVTVWQRGLLCLTSVLAAGAVAGLVAIAGGPRWLAAGMSTFTLAVVSGMVWIPPIRRQTWWSQRVRAQQHGTSKN